MCLLLDTLLPPMTISLDWMLLDIMEIYKKYDSPIVDLVSVSLREISEFNV